MGTYATLLAALAFSMALASIWLLANPRYGIRILDYPGRRSLHDRPVPRSGGLSILAAMALTLPWAVRLNDNPTDSSAVLFGATGFMAAVSFVDDIKGLFPLVSSACPSHRCPCVGGRRLWSQGCAGARLGRNSALVALLVSAANLGFLVLNFPLARIFKGDVGSISMGFLVAGVTIQDCL